MQNYARTKLVYVRGGGDLATGTACRLYQAGFAVIIAEVPKPTVIRRTVALAQCVFDGTAEIEGVPGRLAKSAVEARQMAGRGIVAVLIDPRGETVRELRPPVVVDAIMAKRNTGTAKEWAPIVIGLGPGFTAGGDVHAVVETMRGHDLGRVYYQGSAYPDTGIPGEIGGYGLERLVRSPASGVFWPCCEIGQTVTKGEILGHVGTEPVVSGIPGVLRGLLNSDMEVSFGMKIGDVDPRGQRDSCFTISDKARAIAGGVLEAILHLSKPEQDECA